jgi:hypothetical protein
MISNNDHKWWVGKALIDRDEQVKESTFYYFLYLNKQLAEVYFIALMICLYQQHSLKMHHEYSH